MKEKINNEENFEAVKILGVKVHPLSKKELLKKINYFLKNDQQHYIVTTNPEFLVAASQDEKFRKIINLADLSLADGNGIIWASHFLARPVKVSNAFPLKQQKKYRRRKIRNQLMFTSLLNLVHPKSLRDIIPERLTGADLVLDTSKILAENDYSLYILGGEGDTPVAAKFALEKKFPDLMISGIKGGFPKDSVPDEVLVEAVNKAKPDVLFVALGHPHQEKWIFRNLDKMPSVKLAVGVGGALDFLSGKLQRAPKFMRKINSEWLFRLIQEPRRWQRIKTATYEFAKLVYREKIFRSENPPISTKEEDKKE
jgi:N-acetylglucosaminyldiphosphoundecaprenol N-acetyl-beta-D-mannosaminyltransferase